VGTAKYIDARRQIDQIRGAASRIFDKVDLFITPTAPVPPFAIAELLGDLATLRTKELLMLRNTRPLNALGLPTISIPCGFTGAGLPIGMQITGPAWGEASVLRLAHAYERETQWHDRRPERI
jgi:aspartyl-tRNA(Asn)/glutamyl-tRNA(Gln) amidotransferase subunit A